MDGGRRLLRSLRDFANPVALPPLAFDTAPASPAFSLNTPPEPARDETAWFLPRSRGGFLARSRGGFLDWPTRLALSNGIGGALVFAMFGFVAVIGIFQGGAYDAFIANEGTLYDQAAKAAGFAIKAVTISGAHGMTESEVLAVTGVSPRNSLVFLNVADIRARLKALPLVREASVSKLFPNRLLIEIDERQPFALWQKDGAVLVVAADGKPIDEMHDARFQDLPLVTGLGANEKIADYVAILDAAGDLRPRIRAGIYVAGRRWTLKTTGGLEIALPEKEPAQALSRLSLLEHDSHILEKDILSLDLRIPGRVVAHLTEDAGAAREAAMAKKPRKGAST